jgi:hypothetical protein
VLVWLAVSPTATIFSGNLVKKNPAAADLMLGYRERFCRTSLTFRD